MATAPVAGTPERGVTPLVGGHRRLAPHIAVYAFVVVPLAALLVAMPVAWGWGLGWFDVLQTIVWYTITFLGITVGYHRYFTHGSFKVHRWLRIALGVLGSLAVHGPILHWVADHRRHHALSDRDGDPHSPWAFGTSPIALVRGFWHAHLGWILSRGLTNQQRFAPDLLADPDIVRLHRWFGSLTALTLLLPALFGGLVAHSIHGAITSFFWAGLVRVALVHHVSWSVNSVCHIIGTRPFRSHDHSANFWPLAILSMGESWHNMHHADPSCARHGARRGEVDISARMIWILEKLGFAYDVRWPTRERLARLQS